MRIHVLQPLLMLIVWGAACCHVPTPPAFRLMVSRKHRPEASQFEASRNSRPDCLKVTSVTSIQKTRASHSLSRHGESCMRHAHCRRRV
ncbi:hypothetical protein F5X97DRAFT_299481 [Nemania serpens]|nr:hypothetical protein F5X97DRAFT_299481 [Nemania serpens]